jgi:peptide methionine sulfoxide reductase msrA/msrB
MKTSPTLTPNEYTVICQQHTEQPFSGKYEQWDKPGSYLCRQCGLTLFRSYSKFIAGCGWPSFDEMLDNNVLARPDIDGRREEIICARCQAHLGHVFYGEQFTGKNTRFCVNSVSLDFVEDLQVLEAKEALFAAGCFWGVEFYFKKADGVLATQVGYSGGQTAAPSYEDVCGGETGHFEVIRVLYDPQKISYKHLAQYFFEIHDPFQANGQGPDIGEQYLSVIFYENSEEKNIAEHLIEYLNKSDQQVHTQILPANIFWPAEEYHQDYYAKHKKDPYCHFYVKRF